MHLGPSLVFPCFLFFFLFRPLTFALPVISHNSEHLATLTYNFTLSAYNISYPNDNITGAPLVLGQNGVSFVRLNHMAFVGVQNMNLPGATSGITPHVTSTRASFPYDDYPVLALIDGSLRAYRSDGSWNTNATEVRSGTTLNWITATRFYSLPASEISSILNVPLAKYPLLAAHGRHDLWSLCPFSGRPGQTNVVYNVSSVMESTTGTKIGFNPRECYQVVLFTIPT